MVDVYDDFEQSERVKAWLREYGGSIVLGLVLALGGLYGFKHYAKARDNSSQGAYIEYNALNQALSANEFENAEATMQKLREEYGRSAYVGMAALELAKAKLEAGELEAAAELYQEAVEKGRPEALSWVARERLARVQLDQGNTDAALATLQAAPADSGFAARYAEIKGDIYAARAEFDKAREAYQSALDQSAQAATNQLLELKLKNLLQSINSPAENG